MATDRIERRIALVLVALVALAALVAGLAGCATSPPATDLAAFLERRADCDHFRGEFPDPPDPERMREVEAGIAQTCTGTDAQLAALKKRYRDDPVVTRQLAAFEPRIEAPAN